MPTIYGYPMECHSLFLNLIGNALKFVEKDKTPHVRITCTHQQDMYLFSITDNGIGIPEEHKKDVFAIFKRLHLKR